MTRILKEKYKSKYLKLNKKWIMDFNLSTAHKRFFVLQISSILMHLCKNIYLIVARLLIINIYRKQNLIKFKIFMALIHNIFNNSLNRQKIKL